MLQSNSNIIIKITPTVTDTLKNSISKLEAKVDSLQKIAERSEIGKDFFSEVISLQLSVFLFIVGLAGLLSWKWLTNRLVKLKSEARSYTDTNFNNLLAKHEKIDLDLSITSFDVARSMYVICMKDQVSSCFGWAIKAAAAATKIKSDGSDKTKIWLGNARDSIKFIPYKDDYHLRNQNIIDEFMAIIYQFDDQEITNLLSEIKEKYFEQIYSTPKKEE